MKGELLLAVKKEKTKDLREDYKFFLKLRFFIKNISRWGKLLKKAWTLDL